MDRLKYLIWLFMVFLIGSCMMVLRPVPTPTEANTYIHEDKIVKVFEGPSYDVVFRLENRKGHPYINRGIEAGINMDEFKSKLEGQNVKLKFVDHWTPLDYNKSSPTVAYIEVVETGEILYNNIKS